MDLSCPREKTYLVRSLHRDVREPALEFYVKVNEKYPDVFIFPDNSLKISIAFPALRDS